MKEVWSDSKKIAKNFNLHYKEEPGKWTEVSLRTGKDLEKLRQAQRAGAERAFISSRNITAIPKPQMLSISKRLKLILKVKNADEAKNILPFVGGEIQGVLISPTRTKEVSKLQRYLAGEGDLNFCNAVVSMTRKMGAGARSCIDTGEMMNESEGMLVGSTSNAFFLVQAETDPSDPHLRPFRINAGSVSHYTLLPENKTTYLSELEAGNDVLIVNRKGVVRETFVGRNKIERRPMVLIEAKFQARTARAILQDSDSVRVMTPRGTKGVPSIRKGDLLLLHLRGYKAKIKPGSTGPLMER